MEKKKAEVGNWHFVGEALPIGCCLCCKRCPKNVPLFPIWGMMWLFFTVKNEMYRVDL